MGDTINAVLHGAGHKLRMNLRKLRLSCVLMFDVLPNPTRVALAISRRDGRAKQIRSVEVLSSILVGQKPTHGEPLRGHVSGKADESATRSAASTMVASACHWLLATYLLGQASRVCILCSPMFAFMAGSCLFTLPLISRHPDVLIDRVILAWRKRNPAPDDECDSADCHHT